MAGGPLSLDVAVAATTTAASLSDAELLARVVGGAAPSAAVRAAARSLASMPEWRRRCTDERSLAREHGLSSTTALRITAVWELAERWSHDGRPAITTPRDAVLLLEGIRGARREEVVAILLDARHRPLAVDTVAVGGVNASRLSPRDVLAPALRADAVAVILGHNHPSGDPSPSRSDRVVTAALRSAGELMGVCLLDHVIVARTGHHSFRESERWEM